jgi:hypothetical protein
MRLTELRTSARRVRVPARVRGFANRVALARIQRAPDDPRVSAHGVDRKAFLSGEFQARQKGGISLRRWRGGGRYRPPARALRGGFRGTHAECRIRGPDPTHPTCGLSAALAELARGDAAPKSASQEARQAGAKISGSPSDYPNQTVN